MQIVHQASTEPFLTASKDLWCCPISQTEQKTVSKHKDQKVSGKFACQQLIVSEQFKIYALQGLCCFCNAPSLRQSPTPAVRLLDYCLKATRWRAKYICHKINRHKDAFGIFCCYPQGKASFLSPFHVGLLEFPAQVNLVWVSAFGNWIAWHRLWATEFHCSLPGKCPAAFPVQPNVPWTTASSIQATKRRYLTPSRHFPSWFLKRRSKKMLLASNVLFEARGSAGRNEHMRTRFDQARLVLEGKTVWRVLSWWTELLRQDNTKAWRRKILADTDQWSSAKSPENCKK